MVLRVWYPNSLTIAFFHAIARSSPDLQALTGIQDLNSEPYV